MNDNNPLLEIKNLQVNINERIILKDFNLSIKKNSIHAIMGPNGCGKSTLSKVLAGHNSYQVSQGEIYFNQKNLSSLSPEKRAHEGIFLAFQSPVEIPGLNTFDFLRIAFNQKQKYLGEKELDPIDFLNYSQIYLKELKIDASFLSRNLNEGFSGGEKKKTEILQLLLLQPSLLILDEIDSGVDIDALKLICRKLKLFLPENSSILLITHYPRIFTYLKPDYVHLILNGKIFQSGGIKLASQIEEKGYDFFEKTKLSAI